MAKKINSEYKVNNEDNSFIVTMGTSNKKNPEVIYSILSTYITPISEEINEEFFEEVPKNIKRNLKSTISKYGLCEKDVIVVSDVATSRMLYGKQSYFDMQIYFKPQKDILLSKNRKFKDISEDIYETFVKDIANNIEISLHTNGFLTSKNKNKRVSKAIY